MRPYERSAGELTAALIYTRVSSDDQAKKGLSLDAQLESCRRYVAAQGWMIGAEFQDVLSGTRDDRAGYQQLLAEARRLRAGGRTVVVVVVWLHRFGRRLAERVRCWEEFQALTIPVHSIAEGGVVSELVANILGSVAQEEARQISERVSRTWKHARSQGWHMVGRPPWGYLWRDRTESERAAGAPKLVLDIDPVAAPYVRELFHRVAAGESARSAARWAARLPAEARRGQSLKQDRWMSWRAVHRTLMSPAYIARDCGPRDDRLPAAEVVARATSRWPALVSDETWMVVRERMLSHQRTPHQATGNYLLTGLIYCPLPGCGHRMHGMRQSRGVRYRCSAWTRGAKAQSPGAPCQFIAIARTVDANVIDQVIRYVRLDLLTSVQPEVWRASEAAWERLRKPQETDTRAQRIQRQEAVLASLRERIARATELFCDGQISKSAYDDLCARAQRTSADASSELARLRGYEPDSAQLPSLEVVLRDAGGWAAILADDDGELTAARREVLCTLVERVLPVRVGHGKYTPVITWTRLARWLNELAEEVATRHTTAA